MSRVLRPHLPRAAFHIMAKTQGDEPWFEDHRGLIEKIIIEGVTSSDARYISHAVMPNHFHIVLQQGVRPLGWVMQPIMRRTALLIQRTRALKGHIFFRAYHAKHCDTADYLRTGIIYTHFNGWRAGLCDAPEAYPWTSHARYLADDTGCVVGFELAHVLRLFGHEPNESVEQLRCRYREYVDWWREKDAHAAAYRSFERPEPPTDAGDAYFRAHFSVMHVAVRRPVVDLRDKAIAILLDIRPDLEIDALRRRYMPHADRRVRKQVIAGLLQAGYAGKAIADYFRISYSAVSAIASAMRYAMLQQN